MEVIIQSKTPISEGAESFIREKLQKLDTFYDRILSASVFINPDDGTGQGLEVEARLIVPGPDLFAKSSSESVEKSIIEVVEKLRRQIAKMKEKQSNQ